ncbi:MAG: O-antigen ligase family protein [Proteobacteria bacterium]|nr:O-antigen ligase family protein [Pseudomonadota bacterium]MBU1739421.1 O-antigen ligase family protein [Pseudomonadota bacterium]
MVEKIVMALVIPFGLLCLIRPFYLLYLLPTIMVLGFAPSVSYEKTPLLRIGSINLFITDYLILILLFLLTVMVAKNLFFKRHLLEGLIEGRINKLVLLFFLWSIFIGFLSYGKGFALQNILRNLSTEALMFIAVLVPTIPDIELKKEKFFRYSIFLGLLLVLFSLWKYFTHDVEFTSSGTRRTLLGNTVVIFMLPICYMLFYSRYYRLHRMLACTMIAFLAIGIALTGHRSGFVTLAFVLFFYFTTRDFKMLEYIWVPTAGIAMVILTVLIASMLQITPGKSLAGDMLLRIGDTLNLENKTTVERLSKWDDSLEITRRYPLLGLGRFPVHTDSITEDSNLKLKESFADFNRATHNMFAEQLANTGLLGLSVMIFFLYGIFRQFKNLPARDRRYADFLKTYLWSLLVFSQFNTSFTDPLGKIFFFIVLGFFNARLLQEQTGIQPVHSAPVFYRNFLKTPGEAHRSNG